MSIPASYRNQINKSTPYKGDLETFEVKVDPKSKALTCQNFFEYTLLESVSQTPFRKDLNITAAECLKRCMADAKCKEFVQPYLNRGFKFQ